MAEGSLKGRVALVTGASRIERDFGRLDVLVNNAGIGIDDAPPSRLEICSQL